MWPNPEETTDLVRRKLRILSHFLKKSLMENFIFCAVNVGKVADSLFKDHHVSTQEKDTSPSYELWNVLRSDKLKCSNLNFPTTLEYWLSYERLISILFGSGIHW